MTKDQSATNWTNKQAIDQWGAMPRSAHEEYGEDGDFAKRHLINPTFFRLFGDHGDHGDHGDLAGKRVLDAGCGQGYLSRLLASKGANVTGVEPGQSLFDYCVELEAERQQGIRYLQADLTELPELGEPFELVVCSMVLPAVPDWRAAMKACVEQLAPGGLFVFSVNHPCFENLWSTWRKNDGAYRTDRYLSEYELPQTYAMDFHRPLSSYLNEVIGLGCRISEVAEPGLDPEVARESGIDGIEAYVHLPNFLIVAAEKVPAG